MYRYVCDISPLDELVVYSTDLERPPTEHMAFVMTNGDGQKISVVLTRDDVIKLNNQLNNFIINGHE